MHRRSTSQSKSLRVFALAFIIFGWWFTLAPQQLGGPVTVAVVSGDSMVGSLESGDLIITYREDKYEIGQSVLYERFGGYVIHNLIGTNPDGSFISKGVNNQLPDPWRVPEENIMGVMIFSAPGLGHEIQSFLKSPFAVGVTAVLVSLLVIVPLHRSHNYGEAIKLGQTGATERIRFRGHRTILFWAVTGLAVVSLALLVVLAMNNVPFWPKIAIALIAFAVLTASLLTVGTYLFDGVGLSEPQKSMVILGPTFHRIHPHLKLEATVVPIDSAKELRSIKNDLNTAVLHRVLSSGEHEFIVCGHAQNYIFTSKSTS
jgi:signal peptidase I